MVISYSEFDVATGYFTGRRVTYSDIDRQPPAREGYGWTSGEWDARSCYVEDTEVRTISDTEMARLTAGPPTPFFKWDIATRQWVDASPPGTGLAIAKCIKVQAIKGECLSRMGSQFAALGDPEVLEVFRELWLSIAPAARQPTAAMSTVLNVYQAAKTGIAAVRSAATLGEIEAVTVAWP
jgi:hypothetical protein